jgi:WD40 repeat protein
MVGDSSSAGRILSYNSSYSVVTNFTAVTSVIYRIKQLPNGNVITTYSDSTVRVWNVASTTWSLVRLYTGHAGPVYGVDYVRADTVVTGSIDKTIKVWRISTGVSSLTISPGTIVYSVAMLSDGNLAAAAANRVNIYNVNNGTQIQTIIGSTLTITNLVVLSSTLFATCGFDKNIRIWNQTTRVIKLTLSGHTNNVYELKQASSDLLASSSIDKTVRLWNITSGTLIRNMTGHTGSLMYSLDYYDCSIMVSGSVGTDGVKVWNIFTGESLNISSGGLQLQSLAVYKAVTSK